jgi:L-alanine-DL-glutamate epimerase-like enolase superfamily enzyme
VGIDFVEAPVPIDPVENMKEVRNKVSMEVCANEGLGRVEDVVRVLGSRCADVLNFSSYWVGSLQNFATLGRLADWHGVKVCKHSHGELGLAATAQHHVMLTLPNTIDGCQQTASIMDDDILAEAIPIRDQPNWGTIDQPGLGVTVDEDKVQEYQRLYERHGQFLPYHRQSWQA